MNVFRILGISILIFISCASPKQTQVQLPEEGEFFTNLSEYGIFNDFKPNAQLVKYEVTNALFTDYAIKDRYVYVPEGSKATLKQDGFFDWPAGSMMVKNFSYSSEQIGKPRVMETRLLIKDLSEWKAISYVWNEEQTEAKISKVGDITPVKLNHSTGVREFDYIVPNKNQCKSCHNHNEKIDPLGFKYANLNAEIKSETGTINQIAFLEDRGIIELNQYKDSITTMIAYEDESQDIQKRALAYLDMNCGHCHRPEGPGNTSGLFLQYDETRSNHLGFCKGPVAAGKGSGGRKFDIQPGAADSSILYYRMASLDPGSMMPEVGRSLAHTEGLEIISDWINSLDYNCD